MDIRIEIIKELAIRKMKRFELAEKIGANRSSFYNCMNGYYQNERCLEMMLKAYNYLKEKK